MRIPISDRTFRIAQILSLASTKSRRDTIVSLVENILFTYNEELTKVEILDLVLDIFTINLIASEVEEVFGEFSRDSTVVPNNGKFGLSKDRKEELYRSNLNYNEQRDSRFHRFCSTLLGLAALEQEQLTMLWDLFNEYLLECFYQYGDKAISHFKVPKAIEDDEQSGLEISPLKKILAKLEKPELQSIFKKFISDFPSKLTVEDLDYLESLARKTMSFFSLGLPTELHEDFVDFQMIDWTIFVDTNFLYSVLNLHAHPENAACAELLEFGEKHNLKIKFKFLPTTLVELKRKKRDFDDQIPKNALTVTQISALLKSGKLDAFSQAYYEKLLNNPKGTFHPSEVINTAERTITHIKKIHKYNSKFSKITEKVINEKVANYEKYISIVNEARSEKSLPSLRHKVFPQLKHDVFLREAVLSLADQGEGGMPTTFSEMRMFAVTLDKTLIRYDKYELGKEASDYIIPTFFLPSYLLNKLHRFLPLQTDDYHGAFLNAIATFSFNESSEKSTTVQKFASYYCDAGLDDEKLLLSLITDDIFLKEFFDYDSEEGKEEFLESEINQRIKEIRTKAELVEEENSRHIESIKEYEHLVSVKDKEIQSSKVYVDRLSELERLFKMENERVTKSKSGKSQPSSNQLSLTDQIEKDALKQKIEELERDKREREADEDHRIAIEEYNKRKAAFTDGEWRVLKRNWYFVPLFIAIWSIVPLGFCFLDWVYGVDHPYVKYIFAILTFSVSLLASFVTKNHLLFSVRFLIAPNRTKKIEIQRLEKGFPETEPIKTEVKS